MSIKSTAIFDFLLKNSQKLTTYQLNSLTYLSLLNSFLFLSFIQFYSVSLKSFDNYFFRWFAYKSLLRRFSVLISCNMRSSNHFSISSRFPCFSRPRFFRAQVFQGPGFSGSRFFRVQIFRVLVLGSGSRVQGPSQGSWFRVQGPGPGFRSSPNIK